MGNDGGSIPTRKVIVRLKKKKIKILRNEIKKAKCKLCSLTKEQLQHPIVGDRLGQIYNKKSVIEFLLNKKMPKEFSHIRSLKDVKDLKCTINDKGYLQCQVSKEEFSGINSFYFLWSCGCVLSKNAIDELKMKDKCIFCDTKFDKKDLISLNYTNEQKAIILNKIIIERENKKTKENKAGKDNDLLLGKKVKRNETKIEE